MHFHTWGTSSDHFVMDMCNRTRGPFILRLVPSSFLGKCRLNKQHFLTESEIKQIYETTYQTQILAPEITRSAYRDGVLDWRCCEGDDGRLTQESGDKMFSLSDTVSQRTNDIHVMTVGKARDQFTRYR